MARKLSVVWMCLMIAGMLGVANAATIGFEEFGNVGVAGPAVTNQYAGVVFSSVGGNQNVVTTQAGIGFGNNFLCTAAVGAGLNCAGETILTFSSPVNGLSFYQVGDNFSGVGAKVDVFENGSLSATVDIMSYDNFNVPDLVDLTAYSNVTSIRIYGIVDPGGLGWDNFSFNAGGSGAVPEPTSILLLATGLGVVGLVSRRKRK